MNENKRNDLNNHARFDDIFGGNGNGDDTNYLSAEQEAERDAENAAQPNVVVGKTIEVRVYEPETGETYTDYVPVVEKAFEVEEQNAYHGGEEIEFGGINFLVVDKDDTIRLLIDDTEYINHENDFDWEIRILIDDKDFVHNLKHDDAYGNSGDTFVVKLTEDDIQKAKELIAEYQSLENDLED